MKKDKQVDCDTTMFDAGDGPQEVTIEIWKTSKNRFYYTIYENRNDMKDYSTQSAAHQAAYDSLT